MFNWLIMLAVIKTGFNKSEPIARAFAQGSDGRLISASEYMATHNDYDAVAVYGFLRGCGEVIKHSIANRKDYYYIDHAYINRSDYRLKNDSWFRLTKNNMQNLNLNSDPERWEKYFNHIKLQDWKNRGFNIIVCPPSGSLAAFDNAEEWPCRTIRQLRPELDRTKKQAAIRLKGVKIPINWNDIYAVIGYNTSLMVQALIQGIPVVAEKGKSVCSFASGSIRQILKPWRGDRQPLFNHIANSQFMLAELRSGYAWRSAQCQ